MSFWTDNFATISKQVEASRAETRLVEAREVFEQAHRDWIEAEHAYANAQMELRKVIDNA